MEDARKAVIEYCSAKLNQHAGYLISLIIGFITLITRYNIFIEYDFSFLIYKHFNIFILILIASCSIILGIHVFLRTILWSRILDQVIILNYGVTYQLAKKDGEYGERLKYINKKNYFNKVYVLSNFNVARSIRKYDVIKCVLHSQKSLIRVIVLAITLSLILYLIHIFSFY